MASADARIIEDIVADERRRKDAHGHRHHAALVGERFTYTFTRLLCKADVRCAEKLEASKPDGHARTVRGDKVSKFSIGEVTTSVNADGMSTGTELVFPTRHSHTHPVDVGEYIDADP